MNNPFSNVFHETDKRLSVTEQDMERTQVWTIEFSYRDIADTVIGVRMLAISEQDAVVLAENYIMDVLDVDVSTWERLTTKGDK